MAELFSLFLFKYRLLLLVLTRENKYLKIVSHLFLSLCARFKRREKKKLLIWINYDDISYCICNFYLLSCL